MGVNSNKSMPEKHQQNRDTFDYDPVWKLLDQASSRNAGARFADDVVRLARLDADRPQPWWMRWMAPVPVASFAGVAAAVTLGFLALRPATDAPHVDPSVAATPDAAAPVASTEERVAHLQEVLETEMLFAAVENLDEFSDAELVTLIGF